MKTFVTSMMLLGVAAVFGSAGCVGDASSDGSGSDEQDLSASSRTYVSLTKDLRKCAAPTCGGYYVHDLNRSTAPTYVSGLDFSAAGLDEDLVDEIKAAPAAELVLHGKLGPQEPVHKTRTFIVSEAYRGYPGKLPAAGDSFYLTEDRSPAVQCLVAPCPNLTAVKANTTPKIYFGSYSLTDVVGQDQTYITGQAEDHGAIVAGTIENGAHQTGGYEQVLHASQVFIKLPASGRVCPQEAFPPCPAGKVAVYTQSEDRCQYFDQCVTPGICPQYIPGCGEGMTLVTWKAAPSACNHFACYPDFVQE